MVLTGPLIIASTVLSVIFSKLFGTFSQYAYYGNIFTGLIVSLVMAVLAVLIASLVFGMMAKVFKGNNDFARAFAAISFTLIVSAISRKTDRKVVEKPV